MIFEQNIRLLRFAPYFARILIRLRESGKKYLRAVGSNLRNFINLLRIDATDLGYFLLKSASPN